MKNIIIAFLLLCTSLFCHSQPSYPDVVIETSLGKMVLELYDDTPLHCDNFIKLVNEGFYNGQLFHRVINNFMIQAGDSDSKNAQPVARLGSGGKTYTVPAEFIPEYYHKKGALAAARQGDNVNPQKASSGSQFYIVQGKKYNDAELDAFEQRGLHIPFTPEQRDTYKTKGGSPHLDYSYTVFGEVIEGLSVIDIIAAQPTDENSRPIADVKIIKMYTVKKD
jgi:peptidyl-prolyl cis-trans isomerase B (cyclophilin B)